MPPRTRRKDVSLMALEDPQYLSLVNSPANRSGFKVIRSEDGKETMATLNPKPRTRLTSAKRSDTPLLSISFPSGLAEDDVINAVEYFDLGDDFVLGEEEGQYVLRRTGDYTGTTVDIPLHEGMVATMAYEGVAPPVARSDKDKALEIPGVTLVRMDFSESEFSSLDSVKGWLKRYDIDFKPGDVEQVDGGVIVTRHDATRTKNMEIAPGVTAHVIRSEANDVPVRILRSVVEQAYGNWGWGHLDFAASLADPEFTNKSWDAIWSLQDVLENIVLYSGLPLVDRKTLVHNALESFATYIDGMMDALPTGVATVARADRSTSKETDMVKKASVADTKTVERSDDKGTKDGVVDTETTATKTEADAAVLAAQPVTRGEMADLVTQAVVTAMAAAAVPAEAATVDTAAAAVEAATRSDEEDKKDEVDPMAVMAASVTALADSVKTLRSDIATLKDGETNLRDDEEDTSLSQEEIVAKRDDNAPTEPFGGMFGDRFEGIHR